MFVLRWLSYLPLSVLFTLGDIVFVIGYYLVGYRRKIVNRNLKKCFPEKEKKELKRIKKRFYRRLAEFLAESIKAISISEDEIKKRVVFENPEVFTEPHKRGNNTLVCACHQFNWEWALLSGSLQLGTPIDPIYMNLTSDSFNKLLYRIRSRFGGKPIEMKASGMVYARAIKNQRAIANVGDQIPPRSGSEVQWVPFFNNDTAWFTGQEQLSKMFNMNPVFLRVKNLKRGYYSLRFIQLWDPQAPYEKGEITRKYVQNLEDMIRETPSDWLWSHKRWKHKKEEYDKTASN